MPVNIIPNAIPVRQRKDSRLIEVEPRIMFAGLAFLGFVLFWTLVNTISNGLSFDHDMTEAYVWGREFQLGYYKHPPFWAWIAGAWFQLLPHRAWAFAALSAVNAGIGLLGVWRLTGCFAQGEKRLSATLLLLLTPYYTYFAYRYNANTIFLSLWPWTAFFFVRSIERKSVRDAILFGVFAAFAMLSKYYAVLLLGSCLLAAIVHPRRGDYFRSPLPYLAIGVCAVICAPHLWWLARTGFLPLHYFERQSGGSWLFGLRQAANLALEFAVLQIPALIVIWLSRRGGTERVFPSAAQFWFFTVLCFAPLLLTMASSIVFRVIITSGTGIGAFCLVPLFLIQISGVRSFGRLQRLTVWAVAGTSAAALLISPLLGYAHISHPIRMMRSIPSPDEPNLELAQAATQFWHAKTGIPLSIVAGSIYHEKNPQAFYGDAYADVVTFYSDDRPSEFIDFDFARSPWIDRQRLAREGLLIVCPAADQPCLKTSASFGAKPENQATVTLTHHFWRWQGKPTSFTLSAILPID
jgi:4-amino-4-deoxy-L-arabinose transferase-like glycosyltransferase